MSLDPRPISPMFRIDVTPDTDPSPPAPTGVATTGGENAVMVELMKQLVIGQQKQNRMLEQLIQQQSAAAAGSRGDELAAWKEANPELAIECRRAAETLSDVQTEFLKSLVQEIHDNEDYLVEGEYMMHEFIDRFGPRMAHLNGVLQVLAQLAAEPV